MAIIKIETSQTGEVGVLPSYASILTNDTEAAVLTTGYFNKAVQNGTSFSLPCIAKIATKASSTSDYQVGWYQITRVGTNWSAVVAGNPGDVVLPTVANQLVHATNTTGTMSSDAAAVVNLGNITAGSSAVSGSLTSFAGTGSSEFLRLAAINNSAGNFSTTISNTASIGQSQTISIPDAANSVGRFLVAATATPFTSGNFPVNSGVAGLMVDSGIPASSLILNTVAAGQTIAASSASATPGTIRALTGAMTETIADMTSGNVVGVRGSVTNVGASGGFIYGAQGKVISSGTIAGSSWSAGVFGQLDISTATVNAGQMAPVWADFGATSGTMTDVTGLRMFAGTNTTAAVLNAMDYRYGKASALFELSGDAGSYITAGAATPSGSMKKIRCTIDGVEHFLLAAAVWS